jgi:hypothetical protein
MAEIKVEKKERPSWLMWVIGALALLAIIVLASRGCGDERDDGTADPAPDSAGSSLYDGSGVGTLAFDPGAAPATAQL